MATSVLRTLLALAVLAPAGFGGAQGAPNIAETQRLPDLLTPRQEIAGVLLDGHLVVLGGFDRDRQALGTVEAYRFGDPAWHAWAALPVAVHHPAAAVVDGVLVVVGGYPGPDLVHATDAVQIFDPAAASWRRGSPMPVPLGGLTAVALDGRLVTFGGADQGVSSDRVQAYDPTTDTWEAWPSMPSARDHLGAAVLDGRVHVVGGRNGASFTLAAHEVYEPRTRAWAVLAPMPTGRSGHALIALEGCLIALGGEGNPARGDGLFSQVERFDPGAQRWTELPGMLTPRHGMAAWAADGDVVVAGGGTVAGFGASARVERFTPSTCR